MRLRILSGLLALLLLSGVAAFAQEGGGKVTIPLAEFLRLTRSGSQGGRAPAPVSHALPEGTYRVSIQGDWARVEASLALEAVQSGWFELPLLPEDVVVQEARLDGGPLPVYPKDGSHHAMARGPGRHRIELVYHLPVEEKGASRSVALRTAGTSVSSLSLVVPGGPLRLTASPEIPLSTRTEGGRTVASGSLPATAEAPVTLSWVPLRADARLHGQAGGEKPRLYGRTYQLVTVSEKAIQSRARIDCSILRNEATSFRLSVPKDAEVVSVSCPNLEGWRTEDKAGSRQVLVTLGQPLSGDQALEITTETPVQDINGPRTLPFVYLEGAERVKGSVGVCSTGGIEVLPREDLQEARRIDVREDLPAQVHAIAGSPILLAYEYHRQPFRVGLETKKGEEVAVLDATIDSAEGRTLLTEEGKAVSLFTWRVRNNSRQSLLLALPEGAEVWSAFVDGRPAKPIREADGRVRLPLVMSQGSGGEMGTFPVTLTWARQAGGTGLLARETFLAPRVDIPISELSWQLYLPADRQVLSLGGTMEPPARRERRSDWSFGLVGRREATAPTSAVDGGAAPPPPAPPVGSPQQLVQARTRGVFPVQVTVPRVGQVLAFHRLMVSGDEAPSIVVTSGSRGLARTFGWMVFGVALALGAWKLLGSEGWKGLAWGWLGLVGAGVLLGDSWASPALDGLARALFLLSLLWALLRVRGVLGQLPGGWRRRAPSGTGLLEETPGAPAPAADDESAPGPAPAAANGSAQAPPAADPGAHEEQPGEPAPPPS